MKSDRLQIYNNYSYPMNQILTANDFDFKILSYSSLKN